MIGLSGAHRVGKTTLAMRFSEETGIPFLKTSTSEVFAKLGFDPRIDYEFKIRLFIQNRILDDAEEKYRKGGIRFITDRTPIDMLAYTMADIQRNNLDPDDVAMFMDYQRRCFEVTNRHFTTIFLVQPGIPLIEEEGKAPANLAYIEHINSLIAGLLVDQRLAAAAHYISRKNTDLQERVAAVASVINNTIEKHRSLAEGVRFH